MARKAFREMLFMSGTILLADFVVFAMGTEPIRDPQAIGMLFVAVIAVAMPIWGWLLLRRTR